MIMNAMLPIESVIQEPRGTPKNPRSSANPSRIIIANPSFVINSCRFVKNCKLPIAIKEIARATKMLALFLSFPRTWVFCRIPKMIAKINMNGRKI